MITVYSFEDLQARVPNSCAVSYSPQWGPGVKPPRSPRSPQRLLSSVFSTRATASGVLGLPDQRATNSVAPNSRSVFSNSPGVQKSETQASGWLRSPWSISRDSAPCLSQLAGCTTLQAPPRSAHFLHPCVLLSASPRPCPTERTVIAFSETQIMQDKFFS